MLEDSESDAALIRHELQRLTPPPVVHHVKTETSFALTLREFAPHVILCDHNIPGFGGWEALELAQRVVPDTPFILVTGSLDEETAVAYLKGGASDYILKDRLVRLGPSRGRGSVTRCGGRSACCGRSSTRIPVSFS